MITAFRLKCLVAAVFSAAAFAIFLFTGPDRPAAQVKPEMAPSKFNWRLPKGMPTPNTLASNEMSDEKVELGRHLFYDTRLSINETTSCATCHHQQRAFTEPRKTSVGATGEVHPRNSMSLANVVYAASLNWANPAVVHLERQPATPLFGEDPVEMGMSGKELLLIERLKKEPRYAKLFADAFPGAKEAYSVGNITDSIAAFIRTLISGDSPYDRYKYGGQTDAISASAKRGEQLFFSERLECTDCHTGFNLSGTVNYLGKPTETTEFQNNGLYNIDGKGGYPKDNVGLFEFTGEAEDMGKFKVPTLRNIELTSPYMHDGSIATLEDVIEHYKAGGRTIATGEQKGVGSDNPFKSGFVRGFDLTEAEKADLITFLRSLTDKTFTTDIRFSDPWKR